jgi:hypothetical protein
MNLYYSLIYTTSLLGCDIIFIRFLFQIIILISRSGRSLIERFGLVLTDFLEFYWEVNFWCHWYASRPSMSIRLVQFHVKIPAEVNRIHKFDTDIGRGDIPGCFRADFFLPVGFSCFCLKTALSEFTEEVRASMVSWLDCSVQQFHVLCTSDLPSKAVCVLRIFDVFLFRLFSDFSILSLFSSSESSQIGRICVDPCQWRLCHVVLNRWVTMNACRWLQVGAILGKRSMVSHI